MYVWNLYNNFSLSQLNSNFAEISGKYLTANKTVYVATTGSDITGDGTSDNPYKTITMGVNSIPKNLNGYDATVRISSGVYDEDVLVLGINGGTVSLFLLGNITIRSIQAQESQFVLLNASSVVTLTLTTTTTTPIILTRGARLKLINVNTESNASGQNGIWCINESVYESDGIATINNSTTAVYSLSASYISIKTITGSGNTIGLKYVDGSNISFGTNTISATTPYSITNGGYPTSTISETPTPSNLGTVTTILAQRNGGTCRFKLNALSGTWTAGTSYTICDLTATFSPSVQLDKEVVLRTVGGTYYYGTLTITTAGVVSITPRSSMSALSTLIDETFIL